MLHEIIWQQNARLAEVCLHHPFVRGLADGTLDPYVAQDGFFLNAFARAYALAAAGSQDGETLISLCELLNGVLRELQLHAGFSRATVSGGSSLYGLLACDRLGSASRARRSRPYTPCMRLYGYLGTELAKTVGAGNPYQQWVTTYSGADFQAVVTRVESLLDSIPEDTLAVRDAYEHSMRCALNSFSAMLEPTA
jgi:thiaminase (transcriptional activator TenA)